MNNLFIAILCLLLCGCATPRTYIEEGASTEVGVSAKIACESQDDHNIFIGLNQKLFIASIDGKSTFTVEGALGDTAPYAEAAYVKPGRHYLTLKYAYHNTFAWGEVWFDAEAGKSYVIRRKVRGYALVFWVEEFATNKVVGGLPGGEPPIDTHPAKPSGTL